MDKKEVDLLLQFLGMVFPQDLLKYFEITTFDYNEIPEVKRKGLESGELTARLFTSSGRRPQISSQRFP